MPCVNVCSAPLVIAGAPILANNGMGLGPIGESNIAHKRKFRFTMEIAFCGNQRYIPGCFIKTAARPDITIEETEINYLNSRTWIPGKATWEAITVTYYDVNSTTHIQLLSWLASIYDFTDPSCAHMNTKRKDYSGVGTLTLFDGCGNPMEQWQYGDMWPTSIKFGDLDMNSSEVCEIEMSMRYSNVKYLNFCVGGQPVRCPCTPC